MLPINGVKISKIPEMASGKLLHDSPSPIWLSISLNCHLIAEESSQLWQDSMILDLNWAEAGGKSL
jgi:hypothetical protein